MLYTDLLEDWSGRADALERARQDFGEFAPPRTLALGHLLLAEMGTLSDELLEAQRTAEPDWKEIDSLRNRHRATANAYTQLVDYQP